MNTSTGSDAAVERTVNAVLQVAQTTSIRWVSGCWVKEYSLLRGARGRPGGRVSQASTATTTPIAATTLPKISKVACNEMAETTTPARIAGTDSEP